MASLTGKTALVTGATSGIGFGIARHFLSLGASVVIHGRDRTEAAGLVFQPGTWSWSVFHRTPARLRQTGHRQPWALRSPSHSAAVMP